MKTTPVSHPIVRQIVGRLHVGTGKLAVVRIVLHRMRNWRAMDKRSRRYAIAAALQTHAEHRHQYRAIMGGRISEFDSFKPRYFFRPSDKAVLIKS